MDMSKRREIVAVIPVREGSTRIKNKNFRKFSDKENLLSLKIEHLKSSRCFDQIYVSSDSEKAKKISDKYGVEFLPRDPDMCKSSAKLYQYNTHMLETVPGNPYVAWTMVTSPLFTNYKNVVNKFMSLDKNQYDSLITVLPFREFLINEKGRPLNFNFGHWHLLTQELEKNYTITGSVYIAGKEEQIEWKYWIGLKPFLFEVNKLECVDVDYDNDFLLAELLHQWKLKISINE